MTTDFEKQSTTGESYPIIYNATDSFDENVQFINDVFKVCYVCQMTPK